MKKIFGGSYIANEKFTQATGNQVLEAGEADAVAFGVPFLANPDLPKRFQQNAALNAPDEATFYAPGPIIGLCKLNVYRHREKVVA